MDFDVSAVTEGGYLRIQMEDNGPGYPESFLLDSREPQAGGPGGVSFLTGSTGLGFYFASLVARSHTREERAGYVVTENGGTLGGSVFSLCLP